MIRKLVAWYLAIGVLVALYAWNIDTSENKAEAWPVLIAIAAFWPLWVAMYFTFA